MQHHGQLPKALIQHDNGGGNKDPAKPAIADTEAPISGPTITLVYKRLVITENTPGHLIAAVFEQQSLTAGSIAPSAKPSRKRKTPSCSGW